MFKEGRSPGMFGFLLAQNHQIVNCDWWAVNDLRALGFAPGRVPGERPRTGAPHHCADRPQMRAPHESRNMLGRFVHCCCEP
eukprot:2301708-Lingulodinium_polyedra.AAC.1